ncbi:protocadherin-15-like isoform X2 [Crotalus tigris]|uniref:protocadherin-15-like isoform X2 n=1 Tax=Crotalus tigris TaxID=88082 RepID=UPI00192F4872|nr:protocadherin-15-like isoform X2 [Crotalus tigris]
MFSSVIKVKAHDKDTGNYSAIQYRLIIPPIKDGKEGFVIEPYTGLIKTAMLFKNMRRSYFKFQAIATDNYGKGLSNKSDVLVSIVNQLDMQVIVSNVPPTLVEQSKDQLIGILERYVQDQIPGATVVVESIGARRYGDGYSEEDYSKSDLMIYAIDPQTNRAIMRNELFKFLDGKLLDINKEFQPYLGQGGRILEIRTPDVVANVKKQAQAVGYTEGALLALAVIIILCCMPAILIVMVSYRQRQAECAKTARIQMALPAGKSASIPANNLYEELGDSTMHHLLLLYRFQQSRRKNVLLDGGDRQRAISSFASRAIEAHKRSNIRGTLKNNFPKSASNITFLSDETPLTIQNPLYAEGALHSSTSELLQESKYIVPHFFHRKSALKNVLLSGTLKDIEQAWTLPSQFTRKNILLIMDPIQWDQEENRVKNEKVGIHKRRSNRSSIILKTITGTRTSVREKARQFEQQALQEMQQMKCQDKKSGLSLASSTCIQDEEGTVEPTSECFLPSSGSPALSFSSFQACSEVTELRTSTAPSIAITHHDIPEQLSPLPSHMVTPPPFSIKMSEDETKSIQDPPKPPLPLPPPSPSPPLLPPPSLSLPFPAPQRLSLPSSPIQSTQLLHVKKCTKSTSNQTMVSSQGEPGDSSRKQLKGILKNIHNLADIEKSVANMYGQINKNYILPKDVDKAKPITDIEIVAEADECNLSSLVKEHEKQFPSQATAL